MFYIILIIIIILLIVLFGLNIENFEIEPKTNIKLAIQTVFILKENIPFLREWIIYHLNLGVDKIYLYDNTGSIGRNGSNKDTNKYNIEFSKIINMTDEEIDKELQNILNDYKDNLVYIKWQPLDENNNIFYGFNLSVLDYIKKYGSENDYTCFIDLDEFIISKNNLDLKKYIIDNGADKYELLQKKFIDRFCGKNKKTIELSDCIENINTNKWGIKTIIKNNKLDTDKFHFNMHTIPITTNNIKKINIDDFRFNHYNVNNKQIEWMKKVFKKDTFDKKNDTLLLKYENNINNMCGDKCSDKNNFINNSYDLTNVCSFWN